ncbi:hypothetical protein I553_10407 [Mycobacterium xenopi 4042]|uniref:Uncharacterized protein n=1 Tax=Mycobacterium xenopi 4042 TaxID=1299334 RepID=X7ZKN2_MYCXE|nr:hypothetical protein I553_10407 [Mycobacterium xenopi 4042]EUA24465.1 hypothetical protein I552_3425 [Mycobacterium xenopi 3993]
MRAPLAGLGSNEYCRPSKKLTIATDRRTHFRFRRPRPKAIDHPPRETWLWSTSCTSRSCSCAAPDLGESPSDHRQQRLRRRST